MQLRRSPRVGPALDMLSASVLSVGVVGTLAVLSMASPSSVDAQDRATASCRSELIDPFPAATSAGRAQRAMTEILVEIIDPFEGTPRTRATTHTVTEIVDPFRTGRVVLSEILDPWAS